MAEKKYIKHCPNPNGDSTISTGDCKIVSYVSTIVGHELETITVQRSKIVDTTKAAKFITMINDLENACEKASRIPESWDSVPAVIVFNFICKIGNKTIIKQRTIKMQFVGAAHMYISSIIKAINEL